MLPVKSNITSKACGEAIGSNCVEWTGGQLCSADLCKGNTTLTDVITAMDQKICGTSDTTSPCYTGQWVDFQSSIATSGSGPGFTYTITNFGGSFRGLYGIPPITGSENTPQYKWTKDGDLKIRGTFSLNMLVTADNAFVTIALASIPTNCFPSTWSRSQSAIIAIDAYPADQRTGPVMRGFLTIDFPSGILYFNGSYAFGSIQPAFTHGVYMGGTTFNLA